MNHFNKNIVMILKIGLRCSIVIIIMGLLLLLITGQSGYADNVYPQSISEIVCGVIALKSFAIITLGLLLLILTPVMRMITAIISFFLEHDYLYVMITAIVLTILVMSFIIGIVKS